MVGSTGEGPRVLLSHDLPCLGCGHGWHSFLPCSEDCSCTPAPMPGSSGPYAEASAYTSR